MAILLNPTGWRFLISEALLYGVPLLSGEGTTKMVLTTFALKLAQAKAKSSPLLAYLFRVCATAERRCVWSSRIWASDFQTGQVEHRVSGLEFVSSWDSSLGGLRRSPQDPFYVTHSVFEPVLKRSIHTRIRQLVLYNSNSNGLVHGFWG